MPPEQREFRSSTLRIPVQVFPKIREHIREFYSKLPHLIMNLSKQYPSVDKSLIQINIQMFPMTKNLKKEERRKKKEERRINRIDSIFLVNSKIHIIYITVK